MGLIYQRRNASFSDAKEIVRGQREQDAEAERTRTYECLLSCCEPEMQFSAFEGPRVPHSQG